MTSSFLKKIWFDISCGFDLDLIVKLCSNGPHFALKVTFSFAETLT